MKGNKNKVRKFTPIRDSQKKETPSNKDKEKKKDLICYKCKKLRHIKYDFPLYKSKAKKGKKKVMMATLSDNEDDFTREENEKKKKSD